MKRGGFLPRRTPLQARTPLRSTARLVTRTPLRKVSRKRAVANTTRAKVIAELKARQVKQFGYVFCERCGRIGNVHGHELRGRAQGGSITDPANIRLACDPCNEWAEREPILAAAEGWKISRKHSGETE
jgi:hypothetical protein